MSLDGRKITRESAWGESLVFFPKDVAETEHLQRRLLEEGFVWKDGDTNVAELEKSLKKGLVVYDGIIAIRNEEASRSFTACPVRQVDEDCPTPGQQTQRDAFNLFAAKLEGLEQRFQRFEQRLEGLEAQLAPEPLDKPPHLKMPGSAGP